MQRIIGEERAILCIILEILEGLKLRTQNDAKKAAEKEGKQTTQVKFKNNNSGFQLGVNNGPMSGFTFGGRSS